MQIHSVKENFVMHVTDLTQLMTNEMPVFPGSEPVVVQRVFSIDTSGFNELRLHFSTHTGTHVDCPLHLTNNGFSLSTAPPDRFYGNGLVIDCRHFKTGERIPKSHLQVHEGKISKADFVILHTGWCRFWGSPGYFTGFPVPDGEAAGYLAGFALKGAGIDAAGFDPSDSHDLPVHRILLSKGFVLVENLTNIEKLPEAGFIFCCFPLRINDGDGSPVRAVGIVNE
jgi:kynurenine formamidase